MGLIACVGVFMRSLLVRSLFLFFALAASAVSAQEVNSLTLSVNILGIEKDDKGQMLVTLFKGEENWLDQEKYFEQRKIDLNNEESLSLAFENLTPGLEYAVSVTHDANRNGKMDFQFFPPKPKEGVGVSNNIFRMGPPDYKKAKLLLSDDKTIEINLRY